MATAAETLSSYGLQVGDTAPAFLMQTDGDGRVSLMDYLGKQNVVLYFYPKDDTPGCTQEAKDFRDMQAEFEKAGTAIIGVSKDSPKSHDKFKGKFELNFMLASDLTGKVCEDYGVWVEKNMYGKKYMGIQRATFLIDKQGKIAAIWPKVKIEGHAADVLAKAKAL